MSYVKSIQLKLKLPEHVKIIVERYAEAIDHMIEEKENIEPLLETNPDLALILADIRDVYVIWYRLYYLGLARLYYYAIKIGTIVACCELHMDCKCGVSIPPLKLVPRMPPRLQIGDYYGYHYEGPSFRENQQVVYSFIGVSTTEDIYYPSWKLIELHAKTNAWNDIIVRVDRIWQPKKFGIDDHRELGFAIKCE